MKHNILIAVCGLWLMLLISQKVSAQSQLYAIEPLPLEVSASRTVSLIFAANVKSVDRGSADLLAQKAKATENVILVKASRKDIAPTSLTVITTDGGLHVFEVRYQEEPSALGLQLLSKQHRPPQARISDSFDEGEIREGIKIAQGKKSNLNRRQQADKFSAKVDGFYVRGPAMFIRLCLENRSAIDYEIETLRIFTEDKKQVKRSSSQQDEITVIGRSGELSQVKASEQSLIVLAIPKLTLPKIKRLCVSIIERNGARTFSINLRRKDLSKIAPL